MTSREISWAKTHDWFIRSIGGDVVVREVSTKNGRTRVSLRHFANFPELYRWAGY